MPLPELAAVLDTYLELSRTARERFAGALEGRLLLRSVFDADGVSVVVAAGIAGAAALCVDASAETLREGLRAGLCDFVVRTLDEALRILKNELRRGLPVSVCLAADPEACMGEMLVRGVQPDLVSAESSAGRGWPAVFAERGATVLARAPAPDAETSLLWWSIAQDAVRSMPRIAALAAEALDPGRADTGARRRWLEGAPRYSGRSFGARQCLRMTAGESAAFTERVRREFPAAVVTRA